MFYTIGHGLTRKNPAETADFLQGTPTILISRIEYSQYRHRPPSRSGVHE